MNVTVTDKAGRAVAGLSASDFTLLDDKHPVPVSSFQAVGSSSHPARAHVVLAIDTVNLGYDQVSLARTQVGRFLRQNQGHLANPVSILWLTDDGIQVQGPASTDGSALAAQLDATEGRLRLLNRDAGEWGAIERYQMTVQMLQWIVRSLAAESGRKLLVWVGPGWPMLDNPNIQLTWNEQKRLFSQIVDLTTELRKEQIQMYSVSRGVGDIYADLYEGFVNGVKSPGDAYLPNLSIKVLAVESGGMAMPPSNDMTREITDCVADAGAYYTLTFAAPHAEHPDEYHALKIRVERPGLKARTVTGYYAQPEMSSKH